MAVVNGKVALITGASGIGFEYAKALVKSGIQGIMLADTNQNLGRKAICKLEELGDAKVHFTKTDVTVEAELRNAFEKTIENFHQFDMVINNAGIIQEYNWGRMIKINFVAAMMGSYMAMKEYIPKHKSTKEGIIVNTASVVGIQPLQSIPVYSTANHGLIAFGRAIGTELNLQKYQSRVITICPGLTETPLIHQDNLIGVDMDLLQDEITSWTRQEPDQCGICLLKAIESCVTGSIWITEGDHIYQYPFPDRFEIFRKMKKACEQATENEI